MFWMLTCSLIFFSFYLLWCRLFHEKIRIFPTLIFSILLGVLVGVLIMIATAPTKRIVREYQLANLRTDGLSGEFFLGIGSFGEGRHYRFFREYGGGFRLFTLPVEQVTVFEEERSDAILRNVILIRENSKSTPWWPLELNWVSDEIILSQTFHIPRGSIQRYIELR